MALELDRYINVHTIEQDSAVVYCLDRDGNIVYVNPAWDTFARRENGSPAIRRGVIEGTNWLGWIAGAEVRSWHAQLLDQLREPRPSGDWLVITGECNTPTKFRSIATAFRPLPIGHGVPDGLLVINTIMSEGPIEEHHRIAPPDDRRFRDANGDITQCSGCRRVKLVGNDPAIWCFVPAYLDSETGKISHGLCRVCRDLYFRPWLRSHSREEARAR